MPRIPAGAEPEPTKGLLWALGLAPSRLSNRPLLECLAHILCSNRADPRVGAEAAPGWNHSGGGGGSSEGDKHHSQ